jgi:HD-like signal output (HDOD) protein
MRDATNYPLKAARVEAFPIFRPVARGLEALAELLSAQPKRLIALLSLDPSCTAKVLRAANASGFGNRKAGCVEDALDLLGPSSIRSCVASLLDAAHEQRLEDVAHFNLFRWWAHCTATSFAASHLADLLEAAKPMEAFTMGMLHEIGVGALYLLAPNELDAAIELSQSESLLVHGCERHCVGQDSRELGVSIVSSWRLPDRLATAIQHHEQPHEASDDDFPIAALLFLANLCAERAGFRHAWFTKFEGLLDEVLARARIAEDALNPAIEAAKRGVAAAAKALLPQAA